MLDLITILAPPKGFLSPPQPADEVSSWWLGFLSGIAVSAAVTLLAVISLIRWVFL